MAPSIYHAIIIYFVISIFIFLYRNIKSLKQSLKEPPHTISNRTKAIVGYFFALILSPIIFPFIALIFVFFKLFNLTDDFKEKLKSSGILKTKKANPLIDEMYIRDYKKRIKVIKDWIESILHDHVWTMPKLTNDDVLGPGAHKGLCANCRKRNGIAYPLWFTKMLREEQTGNVTKTTFLRPSRGHVALCGVCLIYERVRTFILGIVATVPVIAYELGWIDWGLWEIVVFVLWGMGIFGTLAVISSFIPTKAVNKYMGSSMALRLAKPVLKSRGCDTFWTKDPWKHHGLQ